jgi:prefoldin beta subunit
MENNEALQAKIQELQILERNSQNYSMEKQNFMVELNGINNALDELKIAKGDVFKIVGGLMVKSNPEVLIKELQDKKKLLDLRIKTIEKQESIIEDKTSELKKEINESFANNK